MLDLRDLELDGVRIAVGSEPVDDRASGIAEPEQLGDLVEGLSGSVVAGVADVLIGPEILHLRCGQIEMRVSAGDHQRQHGKLEFAHFRSAAARAARHGCDLRDG